MILPSLCYSRVSIYSADSLFGDLVFSLYNNLYTFLPPFFFAFMAIDRILIDEDKLTHTTIYHFKKYSGNYDNRLFCLKTKRKKYNRKYLTFSSLLSWILYGIYCALIIYTLAVVATSSVSSSVLSNGRTVDYCYMTVVNMTLSFSVFIAVLFIELRNWNVILGIVIGACVLFLVVTYCIMNTSTSHYLYMQVLAVVFSSPFFWACYIIGISFMVIPNVITKYIRENIVIERHKRKRRLLKIRKLFAQR